MSDRVIVSDLVSTPGGILGIVRAIGSPKITVFLGNGLTVDVDTENVNPVLIPSSTAHINFNEIMKAVKDEGPRTRDWAYTIQYDYMVRGAQLSRSRAFVSGAINTSLYGPDLLDALRDEARKQLAAQRVTATAEDTANMSFLLLTDISRMR